MQRASSWSPHVAEHAFHVALITPSASSASDRRRALECSVRLTVAS